MSSVVSSVGASRSIAGNPRIPHGWFHDWTRVMVLPPCYRTFHLVTSGIDPTTDLIVEAGVCFVRERRLMDRHCLLLDWTREPAINQEWLQMRMERTARQVEWRGGVRWCQELLTVEVDMVRPQL